MGGEDGLKVMMMAEPPSNVFLADESSSDEKFGDSDQGGKGQRQVCWHLRPGSVGQPRPSEVADGTGCGLRVPQSRFCDPHLDVLGREMRWGSASLVASRFSSGGTL